MVCPVDPCTTWMWRCANTIASQFLPAVETRHSLLLVGGSTAAMGVVTQPFYQAGLFLRSAVSSHYGAFVSGLYLLPEFKNHRMVTIWGWDFFQEIRCMLHCCAPSWSGRWCCGRFEYILIEEIARALAQALHICFLIMAATPHHKLIFKGGMPPACLSRFYREG